MGHGASTNVKKLTITQSANGVPRESSAQVDTVGGSRAPSPAKLGWTRSSSDGCIVQKLNTSKTKAELLEQQVDEYKELFRHAEQKADEAQARAKTLEQQMAEVEGTNFELLDRVSELEQQLVESRDQTSPNAEREFFQTLLERDQIIKKQELLIRSLEEDLAKMCIKLKKKLRGIQTELAEARQEAGLKMYSLKDQIATLQEENAKLIERLDRAHSILSAHSRQSSAVTATPTSRLMKDTPVEEKEWEDGRTKVILELSSQLSSQEQRIFELEETVKEKDRTLRALHQQQRTNPRPPSGLQRKQSGTNSHSRSAEKRMEPSQIDSSRGLTADEDDTLQSSNRRQRPSSSNTSAGTQMSSGKHRQGTDFPTNDDLDTLTNHKIRTIGSAGSNSSIKVRQLSANSVDSAMSDHSDSGSAKASSASSSRQRRRLRNQLSRQSSAEAEGQESGTGITKVQSDIRVEGRDSGIGVPVDVKSKYSDNLDQMMQDIIGNS